MSLSGWASLRTVDGLMEGRLLLKNCSVLRSGGAVTRGNAVLIEGDTIRRVADDATLPALPGDWVVPCEGRLVMPGLVDCHSQLLAAQRGKGSPQPEEVAAISAHALALGLRHGVTTHLDHLHAPAFVEEALKAQATVAQRLGARLVQSHASSTALELDANAAAIALSKHSLVRGAIGLSSSSKCDDAILTRAADHRHRLDCGVHLRLAENEEDLATTFSRFGLQVASRLDAFGLLTPRTVGAFARALDRPGVQLASARRTLLAPWLDPHQPIGFEAMLSSGVALGPCTAGERTLWQAVASAVIGAHTVARAGRVQRAGEIAWQMLFDGPARLISAVFGGRFGNVAEGDTADLVVLDAIEAGEGVAWDRLPMAPVSWTIVGGRVVVREGQLLGIDFNALAADAARAVESIWART